jgi:hypothetical protein
MSSIQKKISEEFKNEIKEHFNDVSVFGLRVHVDFVNNLIRSDANSL